MTSPSLSVLLLVDVVSFGIGLFIVFFGGTGEEKILRSLNMRDTSSTTL